MPPRVIPNLAALKDLVGKPLGESEYMTVTQERVNQFADATNDHQFIHVDPERAKGTPFGGTIAHGYLTLSLAPYLLHQAVEVGGVRMALNYGLNKLRFPAPVRVGTRVRLLVELAAIEEVDKGAGVQCTFKLTFEAEGQPKPVCVAEALYRYYA